MASILLKFGAWASIFGIRGAQAPINPPLLLTIKHCQALNIFNGGKQMFMEFLVMEFKGVAQMKKMTDSWILIKESLSVCASGYTNLLKWFVYSLHVPGNQKHMTSYRTLNRTHIGCCIIGQRCVLCVDFFVHMHLDPREISQFSF